MHHEGVVRRGPAGQPRRQVFVQQESRVAVVLGRIHGRVGRGVHDEPGPGIFEQAVDTLQVGQVALKGAFVAGQDIPVHRDHPAQRFEPGQEFAPELARSARQQDVQALALGNRAGSMSARRGAAWSFADNWPSLIGHSTPMSGSFQATAASYSAA